ncbi:MAG: zinc-binding dehydrogenase [Acidimicrobiales bacterium]|nr:zinc-binding dehydrogenase [Acidimicrobiales bacterium]
MALPPGISLGCAVADRFPSAPYSRRSSFLLMEGEVLLKPQGLYLSTELGPYGQNPVLAIVTRFSRGKRVMSPVPRHDQAMIEYLGGLLASGAFTPVIDRSYPLDRIVEAYEYVERGQKIGNVIVTP